MSGDREQQLMVRTVQQEEELRALREQLLALQRAVKDADVPGDARPRSARVGSRPQQNKSDTIGAHNISSQDFHMPAKETMLYAPFPLERQVPAPNGPQRGPSEGHSAVTLDGRVAVFGGTNGVVISNELWTYNIASGRWARVTAGGNLPRGRYGHSAVVHKGTMYVYGGFGPGGVRPLVSTEPASKPAADSLSSGRNACGLLGTLYAYSGASRQWSEVTLDRQEPVKGHSATVYRNCMYIFGGCVVEGRTQAVRAIDLERQCWLPIETLNPQLVAAERESAQQHNEQSRNSGKRTSPTPLALLARSDIPAARSGHTAENYYSANGKCSMVVFGGRLRKETFANDVCAYEYDSGNWYRQYCGGALPAARSDHSASIYKEWLMVCGGYSLEVRAGSNDVADTARSRSPPEGSTQQTLKMFYSDAFVLNLISWTWTKVEFGGPERPLGLCGHSSCMYESAGGDVCVLLVGGYGNTQNDMQQYATALDDYHGPSEKQLTADGSAFGPLDDIWSIAMSRIPKKEQQPVRPSTARPQRPAATQGRPRSARHNDASVSPRGHRSGVSPGGTERKPFSIQTCKSAATKTFSEIPAHPPAPPPIRRTEFELEEIKRRLAVTQVERIRENRRKLEEKYFRREEPTKFMADEQEESVDRLYYQQLEWREQKSKELEERWLHSQKTKKIDPDMIEDTIARLTQVPERPDEYSGSGVRRKRVRLTKGEIEDSVKRLFNKSIADSNQRQVALQSKWLWGAKSKKANADELHAIVERLNAPRSPSRPK